MTLYKIVRETDSEIFPKNFNWQGEDKKKTTIMGLIMSLNTSIHF